MGTPGVALPVQGGTNGRHPAIHHVRRGNHIRPRLDLAQGNPGQVREGLVVVHLLPLEDAAVSMGGVLAHAHVANQVQLREPVLQGFHGLLNHPVAAIGLGALGILLQGNAEEHHLVHPGRQQRLCQVQKAVLGVPVLAGHGGNLLPLPKALRYKRGVNEGGFADPGLPDHPPQGLAAPQAAGSLGQIHGHSPLCICFTSWMRLSMVAHFAVWTSMPSAWATAPV